MTTYQTTYSDISTFSKKERKEKESSFPFISPNSNLGNFDSCGQIVAKTDQGNKIKFCPICDYPMIVRMQILPCEHLMCYNCTKPEKNYCYICEGKINNIIRLSDSTKLYECDWPDCFRFFTNIEKLNKHRVSAHNQFGESGNLVNMNMFGMNNLGNINNMNGINMGMGNMGFPTFNSMN
jgi:hypothetical protein